MTSYYLDPTFDSYSSFQTPSFDDTSTLLGPPDFDLDAVFSDPGPIPARTTGPSGSSSNYTHFPEPLQTLTQAPNSSNNPLNMSTSSTSFQLYDPDSPFNSPAPPVSVRGLTKDGRLKTRLMGVGSDGGFLTSPLIVGKPRVDSRTGRVGPPEISIDSPGPSTPRASLMTPNDSFHGSERTSRTATSAMAPSLSMGSTASSMGLPSGSSAGVSAASTRAPPTPSMHEPTGLGMGISGVPDLQLALESGDYGNPNLKIFGMPKNANLVATSKDGGDCDFLPYPDHMPTTTLGRGKHNVVEVGSGFVDDMGLPLPPPSASTTRFVEHRFPRSPSSSHAQLPPNAQGRPTRTLPARTINKAKSCSALAASAREQARLQNTYEPITPAVPTSTFLAPGVPNVPFNSPNDGLPGLSEDPNNMPFSFSDLYNLGLTVDPVLDDLEGSKKSPFPYAGDVLVGDGGAAAIGHGLGLGVGVVGVEPDLNLLQALPTPYGTVSALSSPSTPYLSDPSPEVGSSNYQSHDELSSSAMHALSSIESTFSVASSVQPMQQMPQNHGRQRCVTYGGPTPQPSGMVGEDMVDPSLLSPQQRHRQVSSSAAYGGSKNFSYPTRYAQQQQQPMPMPSQQQWSAQNPPPLPPMPTTPSHPRIQQRAVTGPPASNRVYQPNPNIFVSPDHGANAYDRNLATFDSLYEQYEEQGMPTPTKRGRSTYDDGRGDQEQLQSPPAEDGGRAKRLRTVASAPCLPARRMRPGPKPKNTKSPQEQHQSVFSATLSPPIPQIRRGSSSYASPLLTDDEDDDDGRFPDRDANGQPITATTITYTPGPAALPGMPRSSVPKEVIQSLYSGIPSHVANGVKVAKRYVCLIEGCERTFPRKSAIESHIQTHLEDKPFVCPHDDCDASFVRQHDLRRHERIHSGNKPFPCPCGKGFARGDALARHRARGICSGSLVPRRS
ncbi:hypothetical protein JCM10207_004097 [Rhodosporidiobolus poonsookiae]